MRLLLSIGLDNEETTFPLTEPRKNGVNCSDKNTIDNNMRERTAAEAFLFQAASLGTIFHLS
jgi:hypothetical protein